MSECWQNKLITTEQHSEFNIRALNFGDTVADQKMTGLDRSDRRKMRFLKQWQPLANFLKMNFKVPESTLRG